MEYKQRCPGEELYFAIYYIGSSFYLKVTNMTICKQVTPALQCISFVLLDNTGFKMGKQEFSDYKNTKHMFQDNFNNYKI